MPCGVRGLEPLVALHTSFMPAFFWFLCAVVGFQAYAAFLDAILSLSLLQDTVP